MKTTMQSSQKVKQMETVLDNPKTTPATAEKKRLLLVEDHALVRAGIRALLSHEPDLEIVGEAINGRDAIAAVEALNPDLIVMDLSMQGTNGIEAIAAIKRRHPKIRILVVTMHAAEEYIHESLKAGADGYMLKDASQAELCLAVRRVLDGKTYLSPDISEQLLSAYRGVGRSLPGGQLWGSLSLREREVLKIVGEGHTNKDAANHLHISVKTVEKHRSNLMKKLGIHNTAKLTAYAIEKGLVTS